MRGTHIQEGFPLVATHKSGEMLRIFNSFIMSTSPVVHYTPHHYDPKHHRSLTLIRALLSSPPPHTHTNTHRHIQPHTQTPVHPYTHAYIYTHTLYLSALHDLPRSHLRSFQLSPTHTCPLPTLALNPAPLKPALYSHLPLTLPFSHLPSPHLPCPASLTPVLCALWLARRLRQRGYTHTRIRIYKHTLSLSFRHTLTLPRSR